MVRRAACLAVGATLTAASCGSITGPGLDIRTMHVASTRVTCQGFVEQTCYQVRERPDQPWVLLYEEIRGFQHEAGFEYTIRVLQTRVQDPPADGSSLEFRLLAVVRKVAVPPA